MSILLTVNMQLPIEKVFFEKTHFLNLAKSKSKRIEAFGFLMFFSWNYQKTFGFLMVSVEIEFD